MTISPAIYHALDRTTDERTKIGSKVSAFARFDARVRDLDAVASVDTAEAVPRSDCGRIFDTRLLKRNANQAAEIDRVRELFARTVRPHSVDAIDETEPLVETIEEELRAEIALALSSSASGRFSPEMKAAIRSVVDRRRTELETMYRALDTTPFLLTVPIARRSFANGRSRFIERYAGTRGVISPTRRV
ncbi:hypothetical protein [Halostagnicola sp. A-GB9-2]|uniref:DUF7260 family protein n=1 Tax=Halostagnicola sp. A-GB9-2 TaxID=3048066 RepID=UPI0024C004E8|nr:hypothetical protein [Halostagnicola sp. A-GB9-2]MDJ1433097.1 hypothetical protein [Halostagnicola sp. A-GB9-2]